MKPKTALLSVALLALILAIPASAQEDALYKRLGGYDAIAAVTDDFLGRLAADAQISRFFKGHSTDSIKRIRGEVVDFLCGATGGPCTYRGRDMKTSHTGLNITEDDWNIAVKGPVATLEKFNVLAKEKDEVLRAVAGLKGDIVGR